jgi:hypothetical protein
LLQERGSFGDPPQREKQSAEIFHGQRKPAVKPQRHAETAFCVHQLAERSLHCDPVIP